jgi:parallel beta-helix repeat protein
MRYEAPRFTARRGTLRWSAAAGLTAAGGIVALVIAGPLDPPAGPIKATHKTLTEVEPRIAINATNTPGDNDASPSRFKIIQPRSYYLTENLAGAAGKHGIEIAANYVTIDLNGYELNGGGSGSLSGIWSDELTTVRSIVVHNGAIRNWGQHGVNLSVARGGRISQVTAANNGSVGLFVGSSFVIVECSALGNSTGIDTGEMCVVENCHASDNSSDGIDTGARSAVRGCTAAFNGYDGIAIRSGGLAVDCSASENGNDGFYVNGGSQIENCVARSNDSDGIFASAGSTVLNSTCSFNGSAGSGAGVRIFGPRCRIEGNQCLDNEIGIEATNAGNIIVRNTCSGNRTNWSIASNNIFGPIIDRTVPISGAIIGNNGPDTLGSTHANANFTY